MISNNKIKIEFNFNNHTTHIENLIIIGGNVEENLSHLMEIIVSKYPISNKNSK